MVVVVVVVVVDVEVTRFIVALPLHPSHQENEAPAADVAGPEGTLPPDPSPEERAALFDDERNPIDSPLTSLGLADPIISALHGADITTTSQLASMTRAAVGSVKGIGASRLAAVEDALALVRLELDS